MPRIGWLPVCVLLLLFGDVMVAVASDTCHDDGHVCRTGVEA